MQYPVLLALTVIRKASILSHDPPRPSSSVRSVNNTSLYPSVPNHHIRTLLTPRAVPPLGIFLTQGFTFHFYLSSVWYFLTLLNAYVSFAATDARTPRSQLPVLFWLLWVPCVIHAVGVVSGRWGGVKAGEVGEMDNGRLPL